MQIYLARNNQQAGPYTLEQLNQMLTSQQVLLTDLMWHTGMSEWKPVGEVTQGKFAYFPQNQQASVQSPFTTDSTVNPTHSSSIQLEKNSIPSNSGTLAPIQKRAFAKIIDLALWVPATLFPTAFMNADQYAAMAKIQEQGIIPTPETQAELINLIPQAGWIGMAVYILLMLTVQAILLHKTGQSIGKKVLGIQIVDIKDKKQVSVYRAFFVRSVIFIIFNFIFMPFSIIIDWAFAFGKNRQALHDHLAKTIVVEKKTEK